MYILQRFYQQYQDQTHLRVLPVTRNLGKVEYRVLGRLLKT